MRPVPARGLRSSSRPLSPRRSGRCTACICRSRARSRRQGAVKGCAAIAAHSLRTAPTSCVLARVRNAVAFDCADRLAVLSSFAAVSAVVDAMLAFLLAVPTLVKAALCALDAVFSSACAVPSSSSAVSIFCALPERSAASYFMLAAITVSSAAHLRGGGSFRCYCLLQFCLRVDGQLL